MRKLPERSRRSVSDEASTGAEGGVERAKPAGKMRLPEQSQYADASKEL